MGLIPLFTQDVWSRTIGWPLSCELGHHTNQNFALFHDTQRKAFTKSILELFKHTLLPERAWFQDLPWRHQTVGSVRVLRRLMDVKNRSTESHQHRGALPSPCTAFASFTADPTSMFMAHAISSIALAYTSSLSWISCPRLARTRTWHRRSPALHG